MGYGGDLAVEHPPSAGAQGTVPDTASSGTLALPADGGAKGEDRCD